MAASFAGPRAAEGRRRRRIAVDADDSPAARAVATTKGRKSKAKLDAELRGTRLPLRKFISRHRWKIWAVGLLLALPIVGLQAGALHLDRIATKAGPAIAGLLDPAEARVSRAYSGFLLLLSSQLAALIWWVRSRSPADFGGRFGVWLWGSAACFLFSACVTTDAHLAFATTVLHFRLVHFPQVGPKNTEILCWLAPCGLFGAALVKSLLGDMRKCPSSFLMLFVAVLCWGGNVFLKLDTKYALLVQDGELIAPVLAMAGHVCLAVSMLLHARFVLFESSAPPVEKAKAESERQTSSAGSWIARLFRRTSAEEGDEESGTGRRSKSSSKKTAKPAKRVAAKKTAARTSDEDEEEEQDEASEEASGSDWSAKTVNASGQANAKPVEPKATVKIPTPTPPARAETPTTFTPPPAKPTQQPPPPAKPAPVVSQSKPSYSNEDEEQSNEDEEGYEGGPDKDSLKGLSKRDRRRLQKQWREQQRTDRAA